ncbi:MAG: DUF2723 domain-containing protein [Cyclobacteriaceae bacterium]|nr:DUF2723 domain-containing protein [Cyclobacteriaceae bacterium]
MNYKRINNSVGWIVFIIAAATYSMTVEPTASFWDVGEFIAVSYKLMVPHPPGAPLFLLIGRMFSFLSMGDPLKVAYWINTLSAIASGFAILFMFWSITLIGQKILKVKEAEINFTQTILLMGAGVVGALAYTYSDTFWFSAVEGEVYAMSSFLTAFVIWAMLKWEHIENPSRANRWIILIAYVFGLSIGVHLLNLVTIPVLGLIYYFKKYEKVTTKGIVYTLGISGFLIILINNIIIPGLPSFAGSLEVFFVNSLGLPFGSGIIFTVLLVVGGLIYGIIYSSKKEKDILNTALLGLTFILIGYSSYAMVVIRSGYNPTIDENDPENIMSVVSYLKREQYGTRPLLYGRYYSADLIDQKKGAPVYIKGKDKYEVADYKIEQVYDPKETTILPRIWSSSHARTYEQELGLKKGQKPTFFDNIRFMLSYQMGHMYWRYFMWNFAGRASDIQDASWLSIVDAFKKVPESIASNRGRNNYLMLPLILGIIGLIYTYFKAPRQFFTLLTLFFLTGLALILYLNSPPDEPRERDYIYVGSFYAFAFFIGFGVMGVASLIGKALNKKTAAIIASVVSLSIPTIMAAQNWDDHDRSDRYFSVDSAKNFLASCAPNAILFTGGDNDTFPLWYVQEVEGFRTDVRVVVLSYFNTDWYINQMTRQAYKSAPFPFSLTEKQYRQGGPNDMVAYDPSAGIKGAISLKEYLKYIKQGNPQLQFQTQFGMNSLIPSKQVYLDIDTASVSQMEIVPEHMKKLMVDRMHFTIKGNYLEKKDLMILDLIASNNWERPIYFNNTSKQGIRFDLDEYLVQEGNAYRLLPVTDINSPNPLVDTDKMFDNMMHNFYYRELNNPKVYYNEDYRKFVLNHRVNFNTLAAALINEGKDDKAREVLLKSLELMPDKSLPYDYTTATTVDYLFRVGEKEKAVEIATVLGNRADEKLGYYIANNNNIGYELQQNLVILRELAQTLNRYGEIDLAEKFANALDSHYQSIQM